MNFRIDDNIVVYPGNFPEHILPRDAVSGCRGAVEPVNMKTFEAVIGYLVKRGKKVLFCFCREMLDIKDNAKFFQQPWVIFHHEVPELRDISSRSDELVSPVFKKDLWYHAKYIAIPFLKFPDNCNNILI